MSWLAEIADEIAKHGAVVRVTVVRADGSTPRGVGAAMLVSHQAVRDTIGGGALELAAISHARALLAVKRRAAGGTTMSGGADSPPPCPTREDGTFGRVSRPHSERVGMPQWRRDVRHYPLGPSLGQCCGGYVRLLFEVLATGERDALTDLAARCDGPHALLLRPLDGGAPLQVAAHRKDHRSEWPLPVVRAVREMLSGTRPRAPALVRSGKGEPAWLIEPVSRHRHSVYVYGAGHVGRALVRVLEDLPFAVTWVDTSAERFPETVPPHARPEITADPASLAGATAGDAFHVVATYSHALDLGICLSLLRRGDFRFLGLIGSATKRARFIKRLANLGIAEGQLARLVCPIGLPGLSGKEPAVIGLSVAAQLAQLAAVHERDGLPLPIPAKVGRH